VSDRLTKSSDGTPLHQHACLEIRMACCNDGLMDDHLAISVAFYSRHVRPETLC